MQFDLAWLEKKTVIITTSLIRLRKLRLLSSGTCFEPAHKYCSVTSANHDHRSADRFTNPLHVLTVGVIANKYICPD